MTVSASAPPLCPLKFPPPPTLPPVLAGAVSFVVQEVVTLDLVGTTCEQAQDSFVGTVVSIRSGIVARAVAAQVPLVASQVSVSLTSCAVVAGPGGSRRLAALQGTVTTVITGLSYSAGVRCCFCACARLRQCAVV